MRTQKINMNFNPETNAYYNPETNVTIPLPTLKLPDKKTTFNKLPKPSGVNIGPGEYINNDTLLPDEEFIKILNSDNIDEDINKIEYTVDEIARQKVKDVLIKIRADRERRKQIKIEREKEQRKKDIAAQQEKRKLRSKCNTILQPTPENVRSSNPGDWTRMILGKKMNWPDKTDYYAAKRNLYQTLYYNKDRIYRYPQCIYFMCLGFDPCEFFRQVEVIKRVELERMMEDGELMHSSGKDIFDIIGEKVVLDYEK